jgi:hypothetical protein
VESTSGFLPSVKTENLVTPRSIALIDKLIVAKLAKKVSVLNENQGFITVFIPAWHWVMSSPT